MKVFRKISRSIQRRVVKFVLPNPRRVYGEYSMIYDTLNTSGKASEDFRDGQLRQEIADLSEPAMLESHRTLLQETELLFMDGPKDGVFERQFLQLLETISFQKPLLLVLDDIRFWNMLAIWHEIARPKLDLTSFGHWSGTGLVEWRART